MTKPPPNDSVALGTVFALFVAAGVAYLFYSPPPATPYPTYEQLSEHCKSRPPETLGICLLYPGKMKSSEN